MKELAFIPFILITVVIAYLLIRFKASWTKRMVEQQMQDENIEGQVLSGLAIPPLRLWLYNRKGDGWAKVRMKDGTVRYARARHKLLGGKAVDFFD